MMNWSEIAREPNELMANILVRYLQSKGEKAKYTPVASSPDDFNEVLTKALTEKGSIRIGPPFREDIVNVEVLGFSAFSLSVGAADTILNKKGKWWAECLIAETFIREISCVQKLDIGGVALVVGAGAAARSAIAALLRIGFNRINITDKFEERGRVLIQDLNKKYFNCDFSFTPQSSITMLPGIHTCVINTTPQIPTNDLLEELKYLNFLKKKGLVIDLSVGETTLIRSSLDVGSPIIRGTDIASRFDQVWIEDAFSFKLDLEDYKKFLITELKSSSTQSEFVNK